MDNIIFLIMRRMRAPLLVLIVVYSVAIIGLVLIPAQDAEGNPAEMSFFHAFYFVSFMSTTIGFGEIPNPFTDAQRLWVSFCIFATVAAWIYAIGKLISLLQDPAFQRALNIRRFRYRVHNMHEPFYLVCGYGQTGGALVRALTDRHQHAVVIDIDPERTSLLQLDNQREYVPSLCADARRPSNLEAAGLKHALCMGVVALTDSNEANLKIAIAAKLMHPRIKVVCRADSHEVEANMASFGTDHIYDPFDTFALYMAVAIEAPCLTLLFAWLSGLSGDSLSEPIYPPSTGLWLICGYGRFGKAMYRHFKEQGLELAVIEAAPHETGIPDKGFVHGRGTEAVTLEEASIHRAVGLIAGTDSDADNLSIIMTALTLNSDLFVVARENHLDNRELFDRVGAHVIMHPSTIIANSIRVRLGIPLLAELANLARFQDESWACELVSRVAGLVRDEVPDVWQVEINAEQAFAVCEAERHGTCATLGSLLRDPRDRDIRLPVIPLLLEHKEQYQVLPVLDARLREGDQLLFCGSTEARGRMAWTLRNLHALRYVVTGESDPEGTIWRWLSRRRSRRRRTSEPAP